LNKIDMEGLGTVVHFRGINPSLFHIYTLSQIRNGLNRKTKLNEGQDHLS